MNYVSFKSKETRLSIHHRPQTIQKTSTGFRKTSRNFIYDFTGNWTSQYDLTHTAYRTRRVINPAQVQASSLTPG